MVTWHVVGSSKYVSSCTAVWLWRLPHALHSSFNRKAMRSPPSPSWFSQTATTSWLCGYPESRLTAAFEVANHHGTCAAPGLFSVPHWCRGVKDGYPTWEIDCVPAAGKPPRLGLQGLCHVTWMIFVFELHIKYNIGINKQHVVSLHSKIREAHGSLTNDQDAPKKCLDLLVEPFSWS